MKNKWILLAVAIGILTINLINSDFSAFRQLSAADLLPVIAIALVSYLLKTGTLSAVLIGIKSYGNGSQGHSKMCVAGSATHILYRS